MFSEISPAVEIFIENLVEALKSINLNIKKEMIDEVIIEIKQVRARYIGSAKDVTEILKVLSYLSQRDFLECTVKCNVSLKSRYSTAFSVKNLEVRFSPRQMYNPNVKKLIEEISQYLPLKSMLEKDFDFTKQALEWIGEEN
ncbi:hypothetical protein [Caldicellulosiruptor morganii]|uniref:Uncharacterized protein n=1 Tax=Caldicellulosiruptor morganii TaxID=1387555 RepID=A0ABY7BM28_9FIRM|nr:hypothetical protein [Caldicellulosiruptor morganii]WAM33880.1 hypothetical protein OTK00_000020 [Caldicellulosiruptor morganii]